MILFYWNLLNNRKDPVGSRIPSRIDEITKRTQYVHIIIVGIYELMDPNNDTVLIRVSPLYCLIYRDPESFGSVMGQTDDSGSSWQ